MADAKHIPTRDEVNPSDTWDLTPLYMNDDAWEADIKTLDAQVEGLADFKGTLGESAANILACYERHTVFERAMEKAGNYCFLKQSENVASSHCQGMMSRYVHLATRAEEVSSFIAPEIQAIPQGMMAAYLGDPILAPYRFTLEKLLRYRPHILSLPEERLLAMQGEVAGGASRIFEQLDDADLKFGELENEKGETVELTHASFRSFLESPSRPVREKAFHMFYAQYKGHENTIAATLSTSVLQDVYLARARNYTSSREASLFRDNMPMSVYDSLIAAVHANLDTVHRYLALRKRVLGLDILHSWDTYVPIVRPSDIHIPYEEAVETILAALTPLGAPYCAALRDGLLGARWVDRYENKAKTSGAYSSGGFDGPPYILMNYRDDVIDSMFTLAHEAGHSMHTWHSARNQAFQNYSYPIFLAEVASTFNEQLLGKYLMDRASDKTMKAYLVNKEIDEIRGTIIRQTMFAEFEKITHELAESGQPLTVEVLRAEYASLLAAYFGPGFEIDEELTLEGMRIPHFYRAFYVYKYATGLSAAIALAGKVINGGEPEREAYLRFLSAGGSKYPLDVLRDAGVDMEKPEPVDMAMARMRDLVNELEALVA